MDDAIKLIFDVAVFASIMVLVVSGLAVIASLMGIFNLGHGEFVLLGAYTVYLFREWGMPILMLSFLLGVLLKVAQGSGTVAMITVSSIMAPMALEGLPFNAVYIACAIGSGSLVGSWMNDSGFWIYTKMSGLTEAEALQTWTPLLAVLGITGYLVSQTLAIVLPLN